MISDEKEIAMPAKRIDSDGNERDMDSPYEIGGYYFTIGLPISENPFPQHDEFNHRRFQNGYRDRRSAAK
ncbi:MAG: hypothetical protein [Caudoviricetes sp.]|nr:MAG: hypothetical protein [Caudoviricetes sp.]